MCGAALFLSAKASDAPRPIKHVAHAYFRVKFANKPEELAALAKDPVRVVVGCALAWCALEMPSPRGRTTSRRERAAWPHALLGPLLALLLEQEKKLAETDLVDALLVAERALLYTMNFDVREYQLRKPLISYLEALGVGALKRQPAAPAAAPASPVPARDGSRSPTPSKAPLPPPNQLPDEVGNKLSGTCLAIVPNMCVRRGPPRSHATGHGGGTQQPRARRPRRASAAASRRAVDARACARQPRCSAAAHGTPAWH